MPYLIKSSEGKRSCSLIGAKKEENSFKNELVEALRGLRFHIEVKITDVTHAQGAEYEVNQPAPVEQVPDKPAAINSNLSSSALPSVNLEECRPPAVKVGLDNQDKKVLLPTPKEPTQVVPNQEQDKPIVEAHVEPPKTKTALNFAPMQVLRRQVETSTLNQRTNGSASSKNVSTIYSIPTKPEQPTPVVQASAAPPPPPVVTVAPPPPPPVVTSPEPQNSAKSEKIDRAKMMEIKAKIDQETPVLPLLRFNRGEFKVGTTIETIYLDDDVKVESAVFVSYDNNKVIEIAEIFASIMYELDAAPQLNVINVGDIVAAKSVEAGDDSWSRALVTDILPSSSVEIYFLDWGVAETLDKSRLRALDHPGLSNDLVPALAVKVYIENMPEAVKEGNEFLLKVNSHDEFDDIYMCQFISHKN